MNIAGGHWYTSSGFWGPASGVIVAILVGAGTAWVSILTGFPRRRLLYAILADTPLIHGTPMSGLVVRYNWRRVREPRLVTVAFRNVGVRDIERGAFDGSPLRFDVGERVLECLEIKTDPADQPRPQITAEGSVLVISPVKISKGACLYANLLVDGRAPVLRLPMQTLTNVRILPLPDYGKASTRWIGAMVAAFFAFLFAAGYSGNTKGAAATWLTVLAWMLLTFGFIAAGIAVRMQNHEAWQQIPSPPRRRRWRGSRTIDGFVVPVPGGEGVGAGSSDPVMASRGLRAMIESIGMGRRRTDRAPSNLW
jgi:hypothetical protein